MTLLDPTPRLAADPGLDLPLAADHDGQEILLARAAFLRGVAADVDPLVARSIRRRASELELTAWVLALRGEV